MATSGPVFAGAAVDRGGGQGTWATVANLIGGDDNLLAVWTKPAALNQVSSSLEASSFGAFADIPAGSTINSVTVRVNEFNANSTRMLGGQYELWDATTAQIGATQAGLNTVTTTNVDQATFTGVTQAQLGTLRVRVRARGSTANSQASNGSVDYASLTVDYTPPALPESIDLAATAFAATAETAGATFAQADLASLTATATDATAVVVPPALPGVATLTATAFDVTAAIVVEAYDRIYRVAPGGSNAGAGTLGQPLATITEAVTRGGVDNLNDLSVRVEIQPGTYRETVTIPAGGTPQPFTVEAAASGVIISGSDISPASDWTVSDAPNRIYWRTWTQNWGVQAWPDAAWSTQAGLSGWTDIIRRREMVIVNGTWVRQVLTSGELTTYDSAYYVDDGASRLYLRLPTGGNIATDLIEVGMRSRCLEVTDRANLTLRGITCQHAASTMQESSLRAAGCNNLLIDRCETRYNNWAGLGLGASDYNAGIRVLNCRNNDNGVMGFVGYKVQNLLMEDTRNSRNNTFRGLWAGYRGWEDGFKLLLTRQIILRRCTWVDNNADGIWFDFDNRDVLIEDCISRGNLGPSGIHLEFCQGPITIRRCKVTGNFRGITGVHTSNLTIDDCDIWDNNFEIQVASFNGAGIVYNEWDTGAPFSGNPTGWTATNNRVWATSAAGAILWRMADQYAVAEGWRTTMTASGNSYSSVTNATPFQQKNSDESVSTVNFATWKTYLGGSRDATSSFASTAPSPPPLLPVSVAPLTAGSLDVAPFVRPPALTAVAFDDDRIDLSWPPIPAASGYDIERNGVIVAFEVIPTVYTDTGLIPNTLYTYRVRAARPGTG